MTQPIDTAGISVLRAEGVLQVTINRADKHNPLSRHMLAELRDCFEDAATDCELRCATLRGAGGRYFAAGGDLNDLAKVQSRDATVEMAEDSRAALDAVREFPVPVVALLNGDALGGGAELALACDMRVMAAHARITYVHGRLALSTGWGGGTDLFDLVGRARALSLLCRGEAVDAARALSWGLADAVAGEGQSPEEALEAFVAPIRSLPAALARSFKAQALAKRRGEAREARRESELERFIESWLSEAHWSALDRVLARSKGG